MYVTNLPMIKDNLPTVFPASLLKASTSFLKFFHLLVPQLRGSKSFSSFKNTCNSKCNCWQGNKKNKTIDAILISCMREYKLCLQKIHLYKWSFQWTIWFFRLISVILFCFLIVFQAMLVVQPSNLSQVFNPLFFRIIRIIFF